MIFLYGFLYLVFFGITLGWFTRQLKNVGTTPQGCNLVFMFLILMLFWWIFLPVAIGETIIGKILK